MDYEDLPPLVYEDLSPSVEKPEQPCGFVHRYEVVANATTFLRYCVRCGKAAYVTQLEHWPQRWTEIVEESE